jgi:hypothetical protein
MPSSNTQAQLRYQVSPIILTGGVASSLSPSMISLISLFSSGTPLDLPYDINDLDNAFGAFNVVPGGQLILQQIGKYPFANQWVAANAVIREPLTLSVLMDTPMRQKGNGWDYKLHIFTMLKATLEKHNNIGGTYTVVTPACVYENLIMTALTDVSRAQNSLPQNAWRFDFEQPLVTLSGATGALSSLNSKLTQGLPTNGKITGTQVGAQSAQPTQMKGTLKIVGALAGGPPSLATNPPTSHNAFNYPASAPSAGFSFGGIS